ncbi:MAG: DNA polymerase IV, partial [Actinomycetota bacterium]
RPVRLLGLGVGGLVAATAPRQLDFAARSWDDIERAVAGVRDRFGHEAVERARLVDTAEEPRHSPEPE